MITDLQRRNAFAGGRFTIDHSSVQCRGLASWWPLNQRYGTKDRDYSNTRHLSRIGSPALRKSRHPRFGPIQGPDLDGTDNSLSKDNITNSPFAPANMSACAWVYGDVLSDYRGIVALSNVLTGGDTNFLWYVTDDAGAGTMRQRIYWTSGIRGTSNSDLAANRWHHVAFTRSLAGTTYTLTFFKDGRPDGGGTTTTAPAFVDTHDLLIGRNAFASQYWDGMICDVRIYNRTLAASEVLNIYQHPERLILPLSAAPVLVVEAAVGEGRTTKNTRPYPLGIEVGTARQLPTMGY